MSKAKSEKSQTAADGGLLRHEGGASVGHFVQGEAANHDLWELAYSRFETPEEEIRKFVKRLRQMGVEKMATSGKEQRTPRRRRALVDAFLVLCAYGVPESDR
jgi:hypothetical protein